MSAVAKETRIRVNGVDVNALLETIEAVKETTDMGKFRFRANNQWIDGGLNRTTVKDFYGAFEERGEDRPNFVFDADEPPMLCGENRGANPVEFLLTALGACVTTALVYHAAARGIHIEALESSIEGDIDLEGLLDVNPDVRKGYQEIRMKMKLKADCPDEELDEVLALGPTFSPVFDTVLNGTKIIVSRDES